VEVLLRDISASMLIKEFHIAVHIQIPGYPICKIYMQRRNFRKLTLKEQDSVGVEGSLRTSFS
jgi:hypothetical protein